MWQVMPIPGSLKSLSTINAINLIWFHFQSGCVSVSLIVTLFALAGTIFISKMKWPGAFWPLLFMTSKFDKKETKSFASIRKNEMLQITCNVQHLKSQLPAVSVKLIELLLLSSAHSVQLTYCDWIKISRGRQSTCCVEIKEGSKDMKIKSLKQNVAIDFISSHCNMKAHRDPSSAGAQNFKYFLEVLGTEMLVFGRRDPSMGTLFCAGFLHWALNFCYSVWQTFCPQYQDNQDCPTSLIHNHCKCWSNEFGGLSGVFAFWVPWGSPSWSVAAAWDAWCVEEAQPVESMLPFPSQMTSVGWRLSRFLCCLVGSWKAGEWGSHRQEMSEGWHSRALTAQLHRGSGEHFCPSLFRAELANICWRVQWGLEELEQALARMVLVSYSVCSPGCNSCSFVEIRGRDGHSPIALWRCPMHLSCLVLMAESHF